MKTLKITVTGDVQGVSYRYWAEKMAKKLGISGWTKNEHGGDVVILAQGEEPALKDFLAWCQEGSPLSTVENVTWEAVESEELKGFKVK